MDLSDMGIGGFLQQGCGPAAGSGHLSAPADSTPGEGR
jgi:hypothetical protein